MRFPLPGACNVQPRIVFCDFPDGDRVEHAIHCPVFAQLVLQHLPELATTMGPILGNQRVVGALPMSGSMARAAFMFNHIIVEAHRLRRHGSTETMLVTIAAIVRAAHRRGVASTR